MCVYMYIFIEYVNITARTNATDKVKILKETNEAYH